MYVATKGGEQAIANAHALLAEDRRGDPAVPEITPAQIREQLRLGVDRVMAEGSLYDPDLAALALKQARGDQVEAIFLLRAYRTTLPRLGYSEPIATPSMRVHRRISATFKEIAGGQILGPTFDYTQRLLDAGPGEAQAAAPAADQGIAHPLPRVADTIGREGLLEPDAGDEGNGPIADLTREPLRFPADRAMRLQALARGDEGFLLSMGYSTQRGYARNHPFAGEIRMGEVAVEMVAPELGFAIDIGDITVTECDMVNQFKGSKTELPQFTRGYGLVFGYGERKAMAMALVDRSLRAEELGEEITAPPQDQEFVLYHCDNVEASGFVQHLKLPHHVDFQSELHVVRGMRAEAEIAREYKEAAE
jgi:alpha-D-ribose 1-methylphosphonate 5-triphosphate synthase subunit PhnI